MENVKSNTGQNLGVAAIITATVTFVLAVIPCLGLIAIIPGIIAIVLGVVGLSQASRNQSAKGLSIAGLIIAIIACLISMSQIFVAGALVREAGVGKFPTGIHNVIKEVKSEVLRELEKENFSIRIEKDGNRVNIDGNSVEVNINKERQRKLEELEGVYSKSDSLQKE
jgi:hypothetical protein